MKIHFLGTSGWFDSALGGTPCIFIDSKDFYLILDAGYSIHKAKNLIKDPKKPIYLFFGHVHLDHIVGLHILPIFNFLKQKIDIYGPTDFKKNINKAINRPFAAPLSEYGFIGKVTNLKIGKHKIPFDFECQKLKHTEFQDTFGYRFNIENKIVTYCCDTSYSKNVVKLAKNADILIHESTLLPGELPGKGWGHANPNMAIKATKKAGAKKLVLTHMSPTNYTSKKMRDEVQTKMQKLFKNIIVAKDDMIIKL